MLSEDGGGDDEAEEEEAVDDGHRFESNDGAKGALHAVSLDSEEPDVTLREAPSPPRKPAPTLLFASSSSPGVAGSKQPHDLGASIAADVDDFLRLLAVDAVDTQGSADCGAVDDDLVL